MTIDFELNTFSQEPVVGQLDFKLNLNVIPCQYLENTTTKQAIQGDLVVLSAGGSKLPTVKNVEATDTFDADKVYGIVPFVRKKNTYVDKDMISVAFQGTVVYLKAGATLSCGDVVGYDVATKTIVAYDSTETTMVKLGNVLADCVENDIVRVLLK